MIISSVCFYPQWHLGAMSILKGYFRVDWEVRDKCIFL